MNENGWELYGSDSHTKMIEVEVHTYHIFSEIEAGQRVVQYENLDL